MTMVGDEPLYDRTSNHIHEIAHTINIRIRNYSIINVVRNRMNKIQVHHCVIINLDTRTDLWNNLEPFRRQWTMQGKQCVRMPGVNYKTQTHVLNDFLKSNRLHINGAGFRHTKEAVQGELGCYMAHYNSWRYVVDNKLESCLILEDGITLLRDDFEQLFIHKNIDVLFVNSEMTMSHKNLVGTGTQGYIVTQKGAQKLLEKCAVLYLPIDLQIRNLCNSNEIHGCTIQSAFVKRNHDRVSSMDGCIHTDVHLNDKQNQHTMVQRLLSNLLDKNVNLDDYL
jgi:GR25 family glycosyltransferase involved in LPS biosynthesis